MTVRGFIRGDFLDQQASFFEDMSRRIRENRIKYREDIVEGLENAPRAFLKLFRSENFVKLLVNLKIKNELVYAVFNNFQSNI